MGSKAIHFAALAAMVSIALSACAQRGGDSAGRRGCLRHLSG
jgi:outer membrane lipoprotein-sorting protein